MNSDGVAGLLFISNSCSMWYLIPLSQLFVSIGESGFKFMWDFL